MIDQKTPALQLPLPHPDNELEDDVVRLRSALTMIDSSVQALRDLMASDDVNMDTVQEIVSVLKAAQGNIGSITAVLATKASADALAQVQADLAAAIASIPSKAPVQKVFGRDGNVVLLKSDLADLLGFTPADPATINSPAKQFWLAAAFGG